MGAATSSDSTTIAFDRLGAGPPLIMVAGAFNTRETTAPLAAALQERFTVFNFERRGRGESGDAAEYAIEREIEDLDAMISLAGGTAAVFGYSSGANLALLAAAGGLAITELALYEPPFAVDGSHPGLPADFARQLADLVAADRRGDAVELFQTEAVRIPAEIVVQMRQAPFRPALEQIAHTLVYDATILGDLSLPTDMLASIATRSLVMAGEQSPPVLRIAARAVAHALPNGSLCMLPDQTHDIAPAPTAAALEAFLAGTVSPA